MDGAAVGPRVEAVVGAVVGDNDGLEVGEVIGDDDVGLAVGELIVTALSYNTMFFKFPLK